MTKSLSGPESTTEDAYFCNNCMSYLEKTLSEPVTAKAVIITYSCPDCGQELKEVVREDGLDYDVKAKN